MKRWFTLLAILGLALTMSGPLPGKDVKPELRPGLDSLRPGLLAYADLNHLAFHHDGIHAGQMSSHDENDLNIDMLHFHGWHKGRRVLARIGGPGVIHRVWSAGPTGRLEFWLDGDGRPTISCDFEDYMSGRRCLTRDEFAAGRYANYTPISFEQSAIVTVRHFKWAGAYYQVSYSTYDQNPGLTTTRSADDLDPEALEDAVRFFESNGSRPGRDPGGIPLQASSRPIIEAGSSHVLALDGAGLVTELRLIDLDDRLDPLSDLRLEIFHDGNPEPAVSSPADALFGNLFDARQNSKKGPYETLALSATNAGYSLRWPMPFARGMKVVLTNQGGRPCRVALDLDYRGLESLPANAMRFHARFTSVDYPDELTREMVKGLFIQVDQNTNYVALETKGRGYYVGCVLYVRSLGSDWWGEGDEMIWVDGEEPAVIRGTGTEDEFNWSFGFKENRSPLSGALRVGDRDSDLPETHQSHSVLYRFRLGDFVPFTESIKVTYERLGSTNNMMPRFPGSPVNVSQFRGDDYRSVAFWYELP